MPSFIEHLSLRTARATLVYWSAVALVVASLFVPALLPCVDYPQHLALSDVARRLADPAAPEQASYRLNYFTYNGLFHVLVAWLSSALRIEMAGRAVVAASLAVTAAAVVALLRALRRPPEHALIFLPILFSFSLAWGFVNYVLATAIACAALVAVARAARRPAVGACVAIAALGLACAFAHVLAMLILCVAAAAIAAEVAWRSTAERDRRALRTIAKLAAATAPLLVGCVYCVAVYRRQYDWDPAMYSDPKAEGSAPPLWEKAAYFSAFATDVFHDRSDQCLLWAAIALAAYAAWRARTDRVSEDSPRIVAPLVVLTLAYFATPMVLVGTHLIFPRLAQWAVLGAVVAMPAFSEQRAARARLWMERLAIVTGINTFAHGALFAWETNDASRVIDDLPSGGAATAVIWEPGTLAFHNGTLTHLAAYYAARRHGQWAFAFARYLSVPVRFTPDTQPAWPAKGWEFKASDYDPRCHYARAFPLVLVKAPAEVPRDDGGEARVRQLVFKQDAQAVKLLSHHGHYWAFDTTGLPEDGTL